MEVCAFCNEEILRTDSRIFCTKCGRPYHQECFECSGCAACDSVVYDEELRNAKLHSDRFRVEEEARQRAAQEKAYKDAVQVRNDNLRAQGKDGYYEYKVISITDRKGAIDAERLMNTLNAYGEAGWRLRCAYTNELGNDSLQIAGFGINSTADQNVLILERFVKI